MFDKEQKIREYCEKILENIAPYDDQDNEDNYGNYCDMREYGQGLGMRSACLDVLKILEEA